MKTKLLAYVFLVSAFVSAYGNADNFTATESYEVATLMVNLAKNITRDLAPPATGAERTITKAVVGEEGNNRIYFIEGQDVYHTGRVLSTYWLRLSKQVNGTITTSVVDVKHHVVAPAWGRALPEETTRLLRPLLNSIYDIAELELSHRNVIVEDIVESDADTIQILGLNNICTHDELNRFRLSLIRHTERNRSWYETVLEHPFGGNVGAPPSEPVPVLPLPPTTDVPPGTLPFIP